MKNMHIMGGKTGKNRCPMVSTRNAIQKKFRSKKTIKKIVAVGAVACWLICIVAARSARPATSATAATATAATTTATFGVRFGWATRYK